MMQNVAGCMILSGIQFTAGAYGFSGKYYNVAIYAIAVTVALCACELILIYRRYKYFWRMRVYSNHIEYSTGNWIKKTALVRNAKILSVKMEEGPVLRKLSLRQVSFVTLGQIPQPPALGEKDSEFLMSMFSNSEHSLT
ncbi:PH domain-containing protein [Dermatophilus congolensis]|uniref:PH domain-containing protein n=2 Tax=Dermatophilus congolensis TaxID=1863 RepID=UPI003C7C8FD4